MSTATTTANTASTAPSANPKVSKFAVKSGFVIPKNKLSGSLVPVFKGAKKNDVIREEEKVNNNNDSNINNDHKVQKETKWGRDLTQDASVRKGRALAYQTRVDQIAQQLKSGSLEVKDNPDLEVAAENADHRSSNPQGDREKLELLELEKREAIGEILKLNPSYKTPPEYKLLLKEAIVPIPIKEYPGYNFLGLIFGPASDTQRRLEKETGTTIKVCGTKADTGEKVEISPSDGNAQDTYEELYINISADTYEKVDVAVELIELLVSSVSGSLAAISASTSVSGANVNVCSQSQGEGTPFVVLNAAVNHGLAQPVVGSMQTPPQAQFQHQIPWFPFGSTQNPMHPLNSSAPILTSPVNMPSLFGPRPGTAAGVSSILQAPNLVPPSSLPQMQVPPRPYMPQVHSGPPRNFPMPAPQLSSAQSNMSGLLPFPGFQTQPTGPHVFWRQSVSSLPQAVANIQPRPLSDRPVNSAGSSTGWSGAPANAPSSSGSSNMGQLAQTMVPFQGPGPVVSQPSLASMVPPSNMSGANMVSPASFPSAASTTAMNPPRVPVLASQVGSSPAFPLRPPQVSGSAPTPVPSISRPIMQGGMYGSGSVSGSVTNFSTINPSSATAPRPHHPGSGDFTFQPHQPQNPAPLTVPRPSAMLNIPHPRPMAQLPAPQAPSFHMAGPNAGPRPIMQAPRPQVGNQMGPPQGHIPAVPFARNQNPPFANVSPVSPTTPSSQMGPRNFGLGPQVPYASGPFPPRPSNPLPQNYPAPTNRPGNNIGLNQRFGSSGGPQVYDPFSPTVSIPPQQQGANPARARRPENDPEYEDLMASVGVK